LPLGADEVASLIAFLKYTSEMNNEGWPPKPKVDGLAVLQAKRGSLIAAFSSNDAPVAAPAAGEGGDPVALGAKLVGDLGCLACHAQDEKRLIGPGWGGLYGSETTLADGSTVKVNDAYLIKAIRAPDAQV